MTADPWRFESRFAVRQYELDIQGHVNNAVYLHWAEQTAVDHVEALGFGRAWSLANDGGWVVREHTIAYHRPITYGDTAVVTTLPQELIGVRGIRRTEIRRASDGQLAAVATTVWAWVRISDQHPARIPAELRRAWSR